MAWRNNFASAAPGLARGIGGGIGAAAGSFFPVVGTTLGAGLGQTIGGLAGDLAGSYLQEADPRQQAMQEAQDELLQQLRQQGQYSFEPIAQREMNRFNQQIAPGIANQFIGQGSGIRGSAFRNALGQGGVDLSERLAALGSGHQMQSAGLNQNRLAALQNFLGGQQNLSQGNYQFGQNAGFTGQQLGQNYGLGQQGNTLQGLGLGLGQQYQSVWNQGSPGFWKSLGGAIPGVAQAGAQIYGASRGNPTLGQQAGQPNG